MRPSRYLRYREREGRFLLFHEPMGKCSGLARHLGIAEPYCHRLRHGLIRTLRIEKIRHKENGAVLVVDGPRFNCRVESSIFGTLGLDVVNMTQFPEVLFAREEGICYSALASITDYDAGVTGDASVQPNQYAKMVENFWNCITAQKMILSAFVAQYKFDQSPCKQCGVDYLEYYKANAKC